MLIRDFLEELSLTIGSGLPVFINMFKSEKPDVIAVNERKAVIIINAGIRELSKVIMSDIRQTTFIANNELTYRVPDTAYIQALSLTINNDPLYPAGNLAETRPAYVEQGIGVFKFTRACIGNMISITYNASPSKYTSVEDVLDINELFVDALRAYFVMAESDTFPDTQDDNSKSVNYARWLREVEKLEELGYSTKHQGVLERPNYMKGWED